MTGDEDQWHQDGAQQAGPDQGDGPQPWDDSDDTPVETERLALDDEEERLPWLESAEDEDYAEEGSDTARMLGLAAAGLLALVAVIGGIWWFSNRSPDPSQIADGSTIEAPKEPYKEAPKDPGGKTFDGTGDTSFAVSEGQTRPAKLGDGGEVVVSTPPAPSTAAKPGAAPTPSVALAPSGSGVGVQVGAFSSKSAAEAGWQKLIGQAGGALSGVSHRVIEGNADIGKVYRLQAVAGDAAGASALCGKLKAAGISCQVK